MGVSYLLVLAVVAIAFYAISAPFRAAGVTAAATDAPSDPGTPTGPLTLDEVAELEAARDAKYREIRDAELDVRTGKLSGPDYAELDGTLRTEAVAILHRLDEARADADADADAE